MAQFPNCNDIVEEPLPSNHNNPDPLAQCFNAGEEMNIMALEDEDLDDAVPKVLCL